MEPSVYEVESRVQQTHWWFVGRRRLFRNLILPLAIPRDRPVLDVGAGTGNNLELLKELEFKAAHGIDSNELAIQFSSQKGFAFLTRADVCALPYLDNQFHLVLATDLIEHVEHDAQAVVEIFRVLVPGGWAIITVPAFPGLWGLQDDVSHHFRRYYPRSLMEMVRHAGFRVERSFCFNYLLLVPIWVARRTMRMFRVRLESENQVNNQLLNALFRAVFRFDVSTASWVRPPVGVSFLLLLRKPDQFVRKERKLETPAINEGWS